MNVVPNEVRLNGYPTEHVLGILNDAEDLPRLTASLDSLNLPLGAVKVFVGSRGVEQFGGAHLDVRGWLTRLSEALTGTSEGRLTYVDALNAGHCVVAVDLDGRAEDKQAVADAFKAVRAWDVNFLRQFVVELLS